MKIELEVGGRAVVIEAEGAVSVRVLGPCGDDAWGAVPAWVYGPEGFGRLGEDMDARIEALRREIAEGVETEEREESVAVVEAIPAGDAGCDGAFVAAEHEAPTGEPGFESDAEAAEDMDLLARLIGLRRKISAAGGFPPYVVFNDRTLMEMVEKRPQDLAGLSAIKGVGAARLEKYGEEFLAAIKGVAA